MSDILLIFPPIWDLFTPYTSIPALAGFLKMHGMTVDVWDANIELNDEIISDEYLKLCLEQHRDAIRKMDTKSQHFEKLVKKIKLGELMSGRVDQVKEKLRSTSNDRQEMLQCKNMLGNMRAIIPGILEWPRYEKYISTLTQLQKAVEAIKTKQTPDFFYPMILARLEKILPAFSGKLVGISVAGKDQLVYAFLTAQCIKEKRPDLRIVMGGAMLPYLQDVLLGRDKYPELDFMVVGEGETALLRLLENVRNGKNQWETIPNLVYYDSTGKYCKTDCSFIENMDELPTPDHSDLPMEKYFLQPCQLAYVTARGCYWNRCAFCSLACNYAHKYHTRDLDKVIDDLALWKKQYNIKYMNFSDEALPPKRLTDLSERLIKANLDINWLCLLRMEDALTKEHLQTAYNAGLRMVSYGLESGNQETLDRMKKGTNIHSMARVLKEGHEVGIWNNLFAIVNFPGDKHIDDTVNFVKKCAEYIDSLSYTNFRLENHSYAFYHPEEFDITLPQVPPDFFGPEFPYNEVGARPAVEPLMYMVQQCLGFHFNMPEFFGYDERRILTHIVRYGKFAIREHNIHNLKIKNTLWHKIRNKEDFALQANPNVMVYDLPEGFLLAFYEANNHTAFNEVTCSLLKYARQERLFSDVLNYLQQVFDADVELIRKDLSNVVPLLAVLEFLKIRYVSKL